jgi:phenylpropionate dioxygenase-like ring-hydroxylating dioxygenase large terminal subunit
MTVVPLRRPNKDEPAPGRGALLDDERTTTSVARVKDDWYVVCESRSLGKKPLATTLYGTPIVVFRTRDGGVGALLDRCPHRNVPLSAGRVKGDHLECGYHGWQFDRRGKCTHVPCLVGEPEARGRNAPSFAARERDGYVWVYATPDTEPAREPFEFPFINDPSYTKVHHAIDMAGTVHAAAENALDVPHTAYLHGGLFRTSKARQHIDVVMRRWHDRAEAQYIGEPAPPGLLGRVLAPGGGVVEHWDRFLMPSITQVEYRLGNSHLMVTAALTPVDDYLTRLWGVAAFKLPIPLPGKALGRLLRPVALIVLGQDAKMLAQQTETVQRFGGERTVSTEVDVLGPHILKLMRDAANGARAEPTDDPWERRFTMQV